MSVSWPITFLAFLSSFSAARGSSHTREGSLTRMSESFRGPGAFSVGIVSCMAATAHSVSYKSFFSPDFLYSSKALDRIWMIRMARALGTRMSLRMSSRFFLELRMRVTSVTYLLCSLSSLVFRMIFSFSFSLPFDTTSSSCRSSAAFLANSACHTSSALKVLAGSSCTRCLPTREVNLRSFVRRSIHMNPGILDQFSSMRVAQ
mmetsp:Transcript_12260/g.27307  ORF Transcript_12260/g.27307 Transcript_12260/m.27307 type:complete len:204 (-) Transcript_12260:267-878(-)